MWRKCHINFRRLSHGVMTIGTSAPEEMPVPDFKLRYFWFSFEVLD
jgi:hypothetical protein